MLPNGPQNPGAKSPISYSKVLVVEGESAFQFFKALLRHLRLLDEIEIRNSGGVNEFSIYLRLLLSTPGFDKVISLGIVRDGENDAHAQFQSICQNLQQVGLSVPRQPATLVSGTPNVSIFILPDCANPGMLETLCLQSVEQNPAMLCVEEYIQCLQQSDIVPGNLPKARLRALLASSPRPELLLGQAAHAGFWPWDSPVFDALKQFLLAL